MKTNFKILLSLTMQIFLVCLYFILNDHLFPQDFNKTGKYNFSLKNNDNSKFVELSLGGGYSVLGGPVATLNIIPQITNEISFSAGLTYYVIGDYSDYSPEKNYEINILPYYTFKNKSNLKFLLGFGASFQPKPFALISFKFKIILKKGNSIEIDLRNSFNDNTFIFPLLLINYNFKL